MTVTERREERKNLTIALALISMAIMCPNGSNIQKILVIIFIYFILEAIKIRTIMWNQLDPIVSHNKNRNIESWTEEECYNMFRFRKSDLHVLYNALNLPAIIVLSNGCTCSGQYAFCMMLYRLAYPTTLFRMQTLFGREYSQISRIFNYIINIVYQQHRHKVNGNIDWYADRFDVYNQAYRAKIATSAQNPTPNTIPQELDNIFGCIDGTAIEISRPHVSYLCMLLLLLLVLYY